MAEPAQEASVFLVDDDDELRESLAELIRLSGLHVESYSSVESFRLQVDLRRAGCLILDIRLPKVSGLEVQRALKESGSDWPIIFLTGIADVRIAVEAMKLGAIDFFIKPVHEQTLLDCIHRAFEMDASSRLALREWNELSARLSLLTRSELQVLELVTQGWMNKQIARRLAVSLRTIENRRASILKKLRLSTVSEIIWQIGRNNISLGSLGLSVLDVPHPVKAPHFPSAMQRSFPHDQLGTVS